MIAYAKCIRKGHEHNSRRRYTDGFLCNDCGEFFSKDSPTYRSGELLSSLWMVLCNIRAEFIRNEEEPDKEVVAMIEKIGIGIVHEDYEELIAEVETIMTKYGKNSESANITMSA